MRCCENLIGPNIIYCKSIAHIFQDGVLLCDSKNLSICLYLLKISELELSSAVEFLALMRMCDISVMHKAAFLRSIYMWHGFLYDSTLDCTSYAISL